MVAESLRLDVDAGIIFSAVIAAGDAVALPGFEAPPRVAGVNDFWALPWCAFWGGNATRHVASVAVHGKPATTREAHGARHLMTRRRTAGEGTIGRTRVNVGLAGYGAARTTVVEQEAV